MKNPAPDHGALTRRSFQHGLRDLVHRDPGLSRIVKEIGPPPFWVREPGFPTLLRIILEQQVSLASARAAYDRLETSLSPITPAGFLELTDVTLKQVGFSRQKMSYARELSRSIIDGSLSLSTLHTLDDAHVRSRLMNVKGIGRWTADIYLLLVLRRPDIWPRGDLALALAMKQVTLSGSPLTPDESDRLSVGWTPWRAIAARLLWHYYLRSSANRGTHARSGKAVTVVRLYEDI